jgi:hypothetical protein
MVHKLGVVKTSGGSHGLKHANAAVGTKNPLQGGRNQKKKKKKKKGASGSG